MCSGCLCARHCSKQFTVKSCHPHSDQVSLVHFSIIKMRNQGSERLSNFPKLAIYTMRIWIQPICLLSQDSKYCVIRRRVRSWKFILTSKVLLWSRNTGMAFKAPWDLVLATVLCLLPGTCPPGLYVPFLLPRQHFPSSLSELFLYPPRTSEKPFQHL